MGSRIRWRLTRGFDAEPEVRHRASRRRLRRRPSSLSTDQQSWTGRQPGAPAEPLLPDPRQASRTTSTPVPRRLRQALTSLMYGESSVPGAAPRPIGSAACNEDVIVARETIVAPVIEAAGGVVWRRHKDADEVLVVHRPKYDDW